MPNLENIPAYYQGYVALVKSESVIDALQEGFSETLEKLRSIPLQKVDTAYEEGKWTPKQLLQHLIDVERILSQRALRFGRHDMTQLPGFDHDAYAERYELSHRDFTDMIDELDFVRKATLSLFKSFTEKELQREGFANGMVLSVENQGFVIAGHTLHHYNVFIERYDIA